MTDTYPTKYKNAPLDALVDPANFYNRECTSYCAWKIYEYTGHWLTQTYDSNAKNWAAMLERNGYKRVSKPSGSGKFVGILPNSGPYGHVYWWEGGNTISEYNYLIKGGYSKRTVNLNEAQWYQITKPTTNPPKGDEDVINRNDTVQMRAVMRDIKGWNATNVDAGKNDKTEAAAWVGKTYQQYISEAVNEGKAYRTKRDAALAYYAKKAANDKTIADLKTSNATLVEVNTASNRQIANYNKTLLANAEEIQQLDIQIADLEKQLAEKPNSAPVDEKAVVENWFVKLWNSLFRR